MKKFLLIAFSVAIVGACKKDKKESENLSCEELKKRMEEKAELYVQNISKESCLAYTDAISAYATVKCFTDAEVLAFKAYVIGIRGSCD